MQVDEYQKWTDETAVYPEAGWHTERELNYLLMAYAGEAGEVANTFKKLLRDGSVKLDPVKNLDISSAIREKMVKELGDGMYYLARAAAVLGYRMSEILDMNHDKLMSRKAAGELKDHS